VASEYERLLFGHHRPPTRLIEWDGIAIADDWVVVTSDTSEAQERRRLYEAYQQEDPVSHNLSFEQWLSFHTLPPEGDEDE